MNTKTLDLMAFDQAHAWRVADLTFQLARALNVSHLIANLYHRAAYYHDAGKLLLPQKLLEKAGPLTEYEYELVKNHTSFGYCLISRMQTRSPIVAQVALFHHERLDGSGYFGLIEQAIQPVVRIVAVADVFDAMTNDRPYRRALSIDTSLAYLQNAKKQFDQRVVEILCLLIDQKENQKPR
jgi:HD-GYP domain-containing protein (c-di-GMP phosphodiesterase class II)